MNIQSASFHFTSIYFPSQGVMVNSDAISLYQYLSLCRQPGLQKNFDSNLIVAQIGRQVLSAILTLALGFQAHPSIAQGLPCEDTSAYYRPLDGLKGQALKSKLHEIIKDAKSFSYVQVGAYPLHKGWKWAAIFKLDEQEVQTKEDRNKNSCLVAGEDLGLAKNMPGSQLRHSLPERSP